MIACVPPPFTTTSPHCSTDFFSSLTLNALTFSVEYRRHVVLPLRAHAVVLFQVLLRQQGPQRHPHLGHPPLRQKPRQLAHRLRRVVRQVLGPVRVREDAYPMADKVSTMRETV